MVLLQRLEGAEGCSAHAVEGQTSVSRDTNRAGTGLIVGAGAPRLTDPLVGSEPMLLLLLAQAFGAFGFLPLPAEFPSQPHRQKHHRCS